MVHKTIVKWGVLANTSTHRLPADFTLPGIAAIVAAGTENEKINQLYYRTCGDYFALTVFGSRGTDPRGNLTGFCPP